MNSSPLRTQLWLVALGYGAVLMAAAGLIIPRYLYELWHRDEVSGGMWAAGDAMLAIFIVCLFLIPTAFLVWVTAQFESFYNAYSLVLLAVGLSAPVCLGLIYFGQKHLGETLHDFCWSRLFCSPFILFLIGVSRFAARSTRAKRLVSYALLSEGLTLATGIGLIIFSLFNKR
jgi:hypothetical protein